MNPVDYWPLLGVATVVLGFVLRFNPMLVVVSAGLVSGFAAGFSLPDLLALIGESFINARGPLLVIMTLPVIGLLERAGLREYGRDCIANLRGVTLTRLLGGYLGLRQVLAMVGLPSVAGHAQTVRPLVAPMAESAALRHTDTLDADARERIKGLAAATDNVGLFFGEDVFLAFGAVLIIQSFYAGNGIELAPIEIGLWALPTALAAFVIHTVRVYVEQRRLERAGRAP